MIEVLVQFNFTTKEEWLEFGQKFSSHKKFEKYLTGIFKDTVNEYGSFEIAYDKCINVAMNCPIVTLLPQFSTKSKKVLKELNNWIKENHYENNYEVMRLRLYITEILNMNLDEVLNRWDEVTNTKIKWLTSTNTKDVEEWDETACVVFENDEIQIVTIKEESSNLITIFSPNKSYTFDICDSNYISTVKEYLTEFNITINDTNKIIGSITTFLNRNNNNF